MPGARVVNEDLFFAHDEMRKSQKEMISDGIEMLKGRGFLLAAAPTGIGKTAAALASSLAVTNLYNTNPIIPKILFLTGRQSQHRIVVETVKEINNRIPHGFSKIRLVDIVGRESMCKVVDKVTGKCSCEEGTRENDRKSIRRKIEDFILREPVHVNKTIEVARKWKTCPWTGARNAAKDTHILVCDYNHIFVEAVRESSLPAMGIDLENTIIIVDEAHNLPGRIRSGLERRISRVVFRRALSDIEEYKENLERTERNLEMPESNSLKEAITLEAKIRALRDDNAITRWFEEKSAENISSKGDDIRVDTQEFIDIIADAIEGIGHEEAKDGLERIGSLIRLLKKVVVEEDPDLGEDEQNDCTRLAEMLEICLDYRDSSALALIFDNMLEEPRVTSHLLDPSVVSKGIFEQCGGSILMSGTLFPPSMYSDILGLPLDKCRCKEYSSDFPLGNRPVLIAGDVTSKFTEREESYSSIISHVRSVIKNTKGNVAVFAPSYSMLDRIYSEASEWKFGKFFEIEEQRMSKSSVERLIARLYEKREFGGTAIFGVLSGKLSEGVDYSDNILNAVVCIGLPLPPPSARQDSLIEYYTKKFDRSRAWKYASLQPAVNSILQALGRPIRKKEDRAIIVLLERRMLERRIENCMPEMQKIQVSSSTRTAERVKSFFDKT